MEVLMPTSQGLLQVQPLLPPPDGKIKQGLIAARRADRVIKVFIFTLLLGAGQLLTLCLFIRLLI